MSYQSLLSAVTFFHSGLKALLKNQGNETLLQYYQGLFANNSRSVSEEALDALSELAGNLLSPKTGEAVRKRYATTSVIDTAIHGGLITEPQSFQAAALQAYANRGEEVLVILACTAVRLNTQTFPRGVLHRGKRYPLFRNDDEQKLTYACPPLTKELVSRFAERTRAAGANTDWLLSIIEATPELFSEKNTRFVEQATLLDGKIMQAAFAHIPEMPEVAILPLEDLTTTLLLKSFDKKDTFYRMIFEEALREDALRTFDDIQGAWKGTVGGNHFFVGANGKGDQTALIVQDGRLVGRDRDFDLPLTEEAIRDGLLRKVIAPGVFLSLQLLVLHGITPMGAYFQIRYLPEMMRRMHDYLQRHTCCGDWIDRVKSDLMSYGFLFALDEGEPLSVDFAVNNPEGFSKLLAQAESQKTVLEAFIQNLPAVYREVIPRNEQKEEEKAVTFLDCII